jgi:hypothetical protein
VFAKGNEMEESMDGLAVPVGRVDEMFQGRGKAVNDCG